MSIRVAALTDTAQISGPGRQLAALAQRLRTAEVELRVITFQRAGRGRSPYVDYLEQAGVRHTVLGESGPLDARLILRLRTALDAFAPSIVQTHGYKTTALAFSLRQTGATWPWIAFSHGDTSENLKVRFYNWLERRLLGGADKVVVMSGQQRDKLSNLGGKVCVVHNAVIPLPAADTQTDARVPSADVGRNAAPVLGVVGRLSPEKGVDVFLHACRELTQRGFQVTGIVAGEGPERRRLETLRNALGLEDRVHFLGAISAVERLYSRLDVLVIPSRSEGLPNVLLEALRADVPVVATRVGAIPDVLEATSAGILTRPNSSSALAVAIAQALHLKDDPESRDARRLVANRFSLERRVEAHLALYRDLLQERHAVPDFKAR